MGMVIGVAGCYHHDVILLLAKAFQVLDRKVLLVDRNTSHTLRGMYPVPDGMCAGQSVIYHDELYFTETELFPEELQRYDVVLIDFGLHSLHFDSKLCSRFLLVSDMLWHHLNHLAALPLRKESVFCILIRDVVWNGSKNEEELHPFLEKYENSRVYYVQPDRRDIKNRYVCEAEYEYQLRLASEGIQDAVCGIVDSVCEGFNRKELYRRLSQRERRRYH